MLAACAPYRQVRRAALAVAAGLCVLCASPVTVRTEVAPDLAAIDSYIARARGDWDVPGVAVAVVKDGAVVLEKGYGIRERGKPDPIDERTLFAIASNTKAFTAAAVAVLVDRQKVDWDDRVRRYLPWFELRDPLASADLRVRDLLSHRAGLGTFAGDLLWYNTPWSTDEVLRRVRVLEPRFPFRARFGYSNLMFLAAGQVVAEASGTTWDAFVESELLEPLGMRDTLTSVAALPARGNVATPHGPVGTATRVYPWYGTAASGAAGGIISSVHDMTRWLLLQLGRGTLDGRRYFSDAQARQMWTPHVSFTIGRETEARWPTTHFEGYGLGWHLRDYHGRLIVSHGGALDGMYSTVSLVPNERLGVVVLTNGMTMLPEAIAMHVIDTYVGVPGRDWSGEGRAREQDHAARRAAALDEVLRVRVPGTKPSHALAEYAGSYTGQFYGDAAVALEGDALVLHLLPPRLVADLTHLQFDTFRITWRQESPWFADGTAQFVLGADGRVAELRLAVPNEDFWFEEIDLRKQGPGTVR